VKFGVVRDPGSGVRHRVEVFGLGGWLAGQLGFDPRAGVRVRTGWGRRGNGWPK